MPIRSIPLDQITESDIAALKDRGIREDETLEYKQAVELASDKGKFELLKDVSGVGSQRTGSRASAFAESRETILAADEVAAYLRLPPALQIL